MFMFSYIVVSNIKLIAIKLDSKNYSNLLTKVALGY